MVWRIWRVLSPKLISLHASYFGLTTGRDNDIINPIGQYCFHRMEVKHRKVDEKMKRFLKMMALALSAVLLVSCAACSKGDEGSGDKSDSKAGFSKDSLCIVYEGPQ